LGLGPDAFVKQRRHLLRIDHYRAALGAVQVLAPAAPGGVELGVDAAAADLAAGIEVRAISDTVIFGDAEHIRGVIEIPEPG
jgi:hypothetical protein